MGSFRVTKESEAECVSAGLRRPAPHGAAVSSGRVESHHRAGRLSLRSSPINFFCLQNYPPEDVNSSLKGKGDRGWVAPQAADGPAWGSWPPPRRPRPAGTGHRTRASRRRLLSERRPQRQRALHGAAPLPTSEAGPYGACCPRGLMA